MAESAKTIVSSHVAFASGADLVSYRDWRHLADLLNDDDTRVASSAAVQSHAILATALKAASGMIEMAAYRGGRYTRADLQALLLGVTDPDGAGVTVASEALKKLTCDLAFWILTSRRKPDVRPMMITGVPEALAALEALRLGEAIFPFLEVTDAAQTDIAPLDGSDKSSYVFEPLSTTARRMFGVRSRDLRW